MNDNETAQQIARTWLAADGEGSIALIDRIAAALRDARAAERERCAQVAEQWGGYKSAVIATEIRALTD